MGIQTMGFHGSDQQSHSQQPLARQNSWYGLTLQEVEGNLGRPLGSMNLDELLKNVWAAEASSHAAANAMNVDSKSAVATPASSLQLQASLALVRSFSGRTVDEVWRDIKHGQKLKSFNQDKEGAQGQKRESSLAETTLENFLIDAGLYVADASLGPTLGLNRVLSTPQAFTQHMELSSSPSLEALSDAPERGRKRYTNGDTIDKSLDRRLKRKIKNRESAARSRARKQAGYVILFSFTITYDTSLPNFSVFWN